jgi:hypothetical protein
MVSAFKQFQTGQKVSLKDLECGCVLTVVPPDQPGLDVVEIGRDYLVLEDAGAGVRTRIPRHLIFTAPPAVPTAPVPAPTPAPLAQSA